MKRMLLLLATATAACGPGAPLETAPATLGGLALQHEFGGKRALQAVARLHQGGDAGVDSAWIAHYGADGPSAILYVGIAADPSTADRLIRAMEEGIATRRTPFRYSGRTTVDGRAIHRLRGQGQLHFVFVAGRKAVWLSADPGIAVPALADALGLPHEHPAMDALATGDGSAAGPVTAAGLGPLSRQLVQAEILDTLKLRAALERSGNPLTDRQRRVLAGSDLPLRIDPSNAGFLLNTFWTLGLANRNPILTRGPMFTRSRGQVGRFASTGGWRLGPVPATHVYASVPLMPLSPAQQGRLEDVVQRVFRPCCDNSTYFPDCNHGMAMLGLLTLLTSQGADADKLFRAAHAANQVWFPEQSGHIAAHLDANRPGWTAEAAVGRDLASGSGHAGLMARSTGPGTGETAAPLPC
ncbi:MAG: hypothetical protein ACN0LA_11580 [Candidatus Longimicrobiales bacterium M2_2A_002]